MSRLADWRDRSACAGRVPSIVGGCLAVGVWMIAIFWFSAQPDLPHAPGALLDFLLKKGLHAAAYGILAVLWLRPLRAAGVARSELWALVLTVAYAATDELHQTRVPGRTGRLVDVAIDAAGALSALILWKRVSRTPEG